MNSQKRNSQEEPVQICSLFFKKNWSLTKKDYNKNKNEDRKTRKCIKLATNGGSTNAHFSAHGTTTTVIHGYDGIYE